MKKLLAVMVLSLGVTGISATSVEAAATINPNSQYTSYKAPVKVTYTYQAPKKYVVSKKYTPVKRYTKTTPIKQKAPSINVNNNVRNVALSIASGKRYVYGANSATAVDCSAFAQQVLAAMGKSIPRTTYAQMAVGQRVTTPQPGDLVYFNDGSHVGVYIGNGKMVDALNPTYGVGERDVSWISGSVTGYYRF